MKHKFRKLVSLTLAAALILGMIPAASAIQDTTYHDPAESWLDTAGRTGTFDANAVVTSGTMYCRYCTAEQNGNAGVQPYVYTPCLFYRVPEYTSDGKSNATRNIKYSDGVMVDEETTGNVMYTSPNSGGIYTGYHWTKSMCLKCGRLNTNDYTTSHCYLKDVYSLYDCDSEFDQQTLPESTEWEYLDDARHTKTVTSGTYCGFCYGTHTTTNTVIERHDMETEILPQPANGRFATVEHCTGCDYSRYDYTTAKAVIASYYGVVDGQPHTITISDLSDAGVSTKIRYGNSASSCTLTSAPNYTDAGEYAVYYEITYTYQNTSMTENGVANVWLREESVSTDGSCACGCGDPNCGCQDKNCAGDCCSATSCGDDHNFVLLDSVSPTCLTLGCSRYLCVDCGKIEKRDYVNALGHSWQSIVVREATCETDGKQMNICQRCGQVETVSIPRGEHSYTTYTVKATCTSPGYIIKECSVCGERTITNITNALSHNYKAIVTPPTCENGGHTLHLCQGCGSSFVTDYTEALGHSWDSGATITTATCDGSGVTEYHCTRCGATKLEGDMAKGHVPGEAATCTDPQLCEKCGAVIQKVLGHDYQEEITEPTCTEMGYTTFTCSRCGDSYKTDYVEPTGHKAGDWIVDQEPTLTSEGSKHLECVHCGEVLETQAIEKIYKQATTDTHGEAVVGGYLVIVTDTDTGDPISGAAVTLNASGSLSILLPDSRLLDYANQTTVTVLLLEDESSVPGLGVAVTDKNGNYAAGSTNRLGQFTVPGTSGRTNGDGKATAGYEDADGNRWTLTVKVQDYETGRPIEGASVSIGKTGNITVTLPDGVDMDENNRISVTVTDNKKNPQPDRTVIVKGDLGQTSQGLTDENGQLIVPAVEETEYHGVYILGYPDGTFGPERNMTRSEAAAIFARLLAEENGDTIQTAATTKFTDVPANSWYSGYVKYLSGYGIVYGRGNNIFFPNDAITRAEFITMAVRFFEVCDGDETIMAEYADFSDLSDGYWAAAYIQDAAARGWIQGYEDGTVRADKYITRAEVVTIVNRLLGRTADKTYIEKNIRKINTFTDMTDSHWAWYDVLESANAHTATYIGAESETWSK